MRPEDTEREMEKERYGRMSRPKNISGHKMLAHIDRILNDHRPITADVFITNYCNNNCPYCTYHRWELEPGSRYMKYEDFVQYGTRLIELGVQGIILTGGGEPTINPDFDKIAEWLSNRNISWGMNSNFNQMKYCKPSYLKVSLDGYDEDSYERCRGVRKYHEARKNVIEYGVWKKENSPDTSLGIQMVAQDVESVYKFYEANRVLPVDYIVFRPVESTGGKYYRQGVTFSPFRTDEIRNAIVDLATDDERVTLNFKWDLLEERQESCTAQWAQIAVNEQGQVMYCCHKPYEIVGDLMDPDILEKKDKYFTNMSLCDVPCRMTAPNLFVSQVLEKRKDGCFI